MQPGRLVGGLDGPDHNEAHHAELGDAVERGDERILGAARDDVWLEPREQHHDLGLGLGLGLRLGLGLGLGP